MILSSIALPASSFVLKVQVHQPLPLPASSLSAAFYNGAIYVLVPEQGYTRVLIYNGSWNEGPDLPVGVMGSSMVSLNGKLYVIGGEDFQGRISPSVEVFDGRSWTKLNTSMPEPVYDGGAFAYNGTIYVVGGFNTTSPFVQVTPLAYSNSIQVYNPRTNSWSMIEAKLPIGLAEFASVFNGSTYFIVGGVYAGQPVDLALSFNPVTGEVENLPSFIGNVEGASLAYVRGLLFLVGGTIFYGGVYTTGQAFALENGSWRQLPYYEVYPVSFGASVQVGNSLYVIGGVSPTNSPTPYVQEVKVIFPPSGVAITRVYAGNGWVYLTWNSTGADRFVVNYTGGGVNGTLSTSLNYVNLTGLVNGVRYAFTVTPVNDAGEGKPSTVYAVPATVPSAPEIQATLGNRNVTLRWNIPEDGGSPIVGYYVQEVVNGSSSVKFLGNVTSVTFTDLIPGLRYLFQVFAANAMGNGSATSLSLIPITTPSLILLSQVVDNTVQLSWTSSQPANFTLLVLLNSAVILNKELGRSTQFQFSMQKYGNYTFSVMPWNSAGRGNWTNVTVEYYPRPEPPAVTATYKDGELNLSWSPVPYASYYLVEVNGSPFITKQDYLTLNLTYGYYLIKVYEVNPLGRSSPAQIWYTIPAPLNASTSTTSYTEVRNTSIETTSSLYQTNSTSMSIATSSASNSSTTSLTTFSSPEPSTGPKVVEAGGGNTPGFNNFLIYATLGIIMIAALLILIKR
jgi:hypothetical protein